MKKIFLDTNIFLRFFLKDEESKYKTVYELFEKIEGGMFNPYTSSIVFLELNYVLRRIYKLSVKEVLDHINAIKKMRGMTIVEQTDTDNAIELYRKHKIKLGDCYIAVQIPIGAVLLTYDEDFGKIENLNPQTPETILQ